MDPVLVRLPALVQAAVVGAMAGRTDARTVSRLDVLAQGSLPFTLEVVTSTSLTIDDLRGSLRDDILALAARHNARSVAVFGSVARGDAQPDSDIDFLVEFERGSTLLDLIRLSDDLQDLLGRRVDVVSLGGLKARDTAIRADAVSL